MPFHCEFSTLRDCFVLEREHVPLPESHIAIQTWAFESSARSLLPGAPRYACAAHDKFFADIGFTEARPTSDETRMCLHDTDVSENQEFRIPAFVDARRTNSSNPRPCTSAEMVEALEGSPLPGGLPDRDQVGV